MCFNALRRAPIVRSVSSDDPRIAALNNWITRIRAVAGGTLEPASGDASFRRYFRLQNPGQSFIVMDAPPDREDSAPFVRVAAYLDDMELNAPRVLEADLEQGFLLLSDLGDRQYLDTIVDDPGSASRLYDDAIAALLRMQHRGVSHQTSLPPYDEALLRFELSLFRDWLCGTHLELGFTSEDEAEWKACCDRLVANALDQPRVFVHRDYHSRNLMVMDENNPGVLDFQDAVEGPITYDLVSLLKDCYVQWPETWILERARAFYTQLDDSARRAMTEKRFLRYFELMGVQRHLKAAGIFCRLFHRDGKSGYLGDVPRTLSYITRISDRYEELAFLGRLIETRVLPVWDDAR